MSTGVEADDQQVPGAMPTYHKFGTLVGAVTGPLFLICIAAALYLYYRYEVPSVRD